MLGSIPALPLHTAGKYVAGAYIVLFALVLIYVAIMAIRLSRIEGELGELLHMTASSPEGERAQQPQVEQEVAPSPASTFDDDASLEGETERESTPA